ncbi:MAG: radical SAM protein [Alphaproteobacteria bacterium]
MRGFWRAARDFDRLGSWDDPALARALAWYRAVATNRRPAKFRIAATIPTALDIARAPEEQLWAELDRLTDVFLDCLAGVRDGAALPAPASGASLLALASELVQRMLRHCNFCRWECGVDRALGGKWGACKLGADARVSSYFHHPGEELVYRGTTGSGTIFFTSCNMRCAFCQNGDISTDKDNGVVTDARSLATMAWLLRMEGCHNINWVGGDPTIHLHRIVEAVALLGHGFAPSKDDVRRALGPKADRWHDLDPEAATYDGAFNVPMLWNSNFFMTPEAMKILRLVTDVWLPDFKFGPGRCAMTLAKTPWYWETVTGNLALIREWGEDFTIRHLVMPSHVECCTVPVLDWIALNMPEAPVNVMDQFHPDNFCDPRSDTYRPEHAPIARRPTAAELRQAFHHARERGLAFESISFEKNATGLKIGGAAKTPRRARRPHRSAIRPEAAPNSAPAVTRSSRPSRRAP